MRKTFEQVLKSNGVNISLEYQRLQKLFYEEEFISNSMFITAFDFFNNKRIFKKLLFCGTAIDLEDFENFNKFHFKNKISSCNLDDLVNFCEYLINLVNGLLKSDPTIKLPYDILSIADQINKIIAKINYVACEHGYFISYIPKDQTTITVAETVDSNLSYKVLAYNHHSMKGKLDKKREFLRDFAHELEPKQADLEKINKNFKNDLFFLFNNMDIRHNNLDSNNGKKYKEFVDNMSNEELEGWYDYTYKMCLLAFLELEHLKRKEELEQLKEKSK